MSGLFYRETLKFCFVRSERGCPVRSALISTVLFRTIERARYQDRNKAGRKSEIFLCDFAKFDLVEISGQFPPPHSPFTFHFTFRAADTFTCTCSLLPAHFFPFFSRPTSFSRQSIRKRDPETRCLHPRFNMRVRTTTQLSSLSTMRV